MGGISLFAQNRLTVDLSTLPATRNAAPFTRAWDNFFIQFPPWPANINWSNFNRAIIRIKYFDENGVEIRQSDSRAVAILVYDPAGDIFGLPNGGPSSNIPLKELNVGGGSGMVHRDNGARISLDRAPGGINFQNNDLSVRFIEVTEITFFRR